MQRVPGASVLAASHTTELSQRFGRRVRNLVALHGPTLGLSLSQDSAAAGRWETQEGAEYYAAGVDTGIAGFRALLGLIDDPVRSKADAESQLMRDRTWDWYKSDFIPRLKPGARIILIMTRWHEDDLAGRILNESGKRWKVIKIKAEAGADDPLGRKPGQFLWDDDEYGYNHVLQREKAMQSPRNWQAMYQQEPSPETGNFFLRSYLKPYDHLPPLERMSCYGASDYAVTSDGGDYTVHGVFGLDPQGRMYLCDFWRRQASTDVWVEAFCDMVKRWKPLEWAEEQGQIKSGVGPFRDQMMRQRQSYTLCTPFPTRGDKAVRAQSIRGRMALDCLYVPVTAPWYADFESELLSFPYGKHDDIGDMVGLFGQLLDKVTVGRTKPPRDKSVESGYTQRDIEREFVSFDKTFA